MEVYNKDETKIHARKLEQYILNGEIFIHPTDTIYGIGCDATNDEAVKKVREVKDRPNASFSIIAPSKVWIRENCITDDEVEGWLNKLPGPYTLILKLKNKDAISKEVNVANPESIGVRIPKHWISEVVEKKGTPCITTSANVAGRDFMTELDNLDPQIKRKVKFAIYEGPKNGKPSKIVFLDKKETEVKER